MGASKRFWRRVAVVVIVLSASLVIVSRASAGAVLLSQTRSVAAHVRAISEQAFFEQASSLGSFDKSVGAELNESEDIDGDVNVIRGIAHATQNSLVTPSLLRFAGTLDDSSDDSISGSRDNDAAFLFDVTFRLDRPHDFALQFVFPVADQGSTFQQQFVFIREADQTDLLGGAGQFPDDSGDLSGVLGAGTYRLKFFASVDDFDGEASYGVHGLPDGSREPFTAQLNLSPTPVPLPAAAWSALAGVASLIALRSARVLRRIALIF